MDKKDFNENEHLENSNTPEGEPSTVSPESSDPIQPAGQEASSEEALIPQESVQASTEDPGKPEAPKAEETVPVMNKVGGGSTPPLHRLQPAAARAGWLLRSCSQRL